MNKDHRIQTYLQKRTRTCVNRIVYLIHATKNQASTIHTYTRICTLIVINKVDLSCNLRNVYECVEYTVVCVLKK